MPNSLKLSLHEHLVKAHEHAQQALNLAAEEFEFRYADATRNGKAAALVEATKRLQEIGQAKIMLKSLCDLRG